MKRVLAYFLLFFFGGILLVASNRDLMKMASEKMYSDVGPLGSDKYQYGDLYGLSYLENFKKDDFVLSKKPQFNIGYGPRNLRLDIIGDSYLYSFDSLNNHSFAGVKDVQFAKWNNRNWLELPQKSAQKKIFLIEIVERNLWKNSSLHAIKSILKLKDSTKFEDHGPLEIESNVEFLLFDHRFLTPIKEFKANLLYKLMGKVPGEVAVSADQKYLYLKETLEGNQESNSFFPITESSFKELEGRLNEIDSYLKSKGYDEVWLFVAPNPVRVLGTESKRPNQLFEFLGQSKTLQMKFLSILPVFSKNPTFYYHQADSHWNDHGITEFKKLINNQLLKITP